MDKKVPILRFIKEFYQEYSYPPSVAEITAACGFSSTSVTQYHINKLVESGKLSRQPRMARTLTVNDESQGT